MLPMFTSKSFMVSGLTFNSLLHFGFILIYDVRKLTLTLLHRALHFPQYHLVKVYFASFCTFASLSWNNQPFKHGFISRIFILFHWSMCLVLFQYHTVLVTITLLYFEIRICDISSFVLLLKDCFGYCGSFVVPYKF